MSCNLAVMNEYFVLRDLSTNDNIELDGPDLTLGRDPDCDIVVDSNEASRRHARVFFSGASVLVEDLGSTNGTMLNNSRVRAPQPLSGGDILIVGHVHYLVVAPGSTGDQTILGGRLATPDQSFVVDEGDADRTSVRLAFPTPAGWNPIDNFGSALDAGKSDLDVLSELAVRHALTADNTSAVLMVVDDEALHTLYSLPFAPGRSSWTIGRSPSCDLTINHITISAIHAVITCDNGDWQVEDRQSTNGTTLNGKRVESKQIKDGDRVGFGKVHLVFKALS